MKRWIALALLVAALSLLCVPACATTASDDAALTEAALAEGLSTHDTAALIKAVGRMRALLDADAPESVAATPAPTPEAVRDALPADTPPVAETPVATAPPAPEPTLAPGQKVLYLTIDDGPSEHTFELLEILAEYDIKATFFMVGAKLRKHADAVRAIRDEGHVIACHSYNHDRDLLTKSVSSFMSELAKFDRTLSEVLGATTETRILRVPFGSKTVSAATLRAAEKAGYLWIDWNCVNGDADGSVKTDADMLHQAISTARHRDGVVMLIHDRTERTVRVLPDILDAFIADGYVFRVVTIDMPPVESVKMGYPIS